MNLNFWMILGFAGQGIFSIRFLVQWFVSEQKGTSTIPVVFWYLSLIGGIILFAYASYRREPVFMIGQGTGIIVYLRNLALIKRKEAKNSMVKLGIHQVKA